MTTDIRKLVTYTVIRTHDREFEIRLTELMKEFNIEEIRTRSLPAPHIHSAFLREMQSYAKKLMGKE